jgi:hypothetical protein
LNIFESILKKLKKRKEKTKKRKELNKKIRKRAVGGLTGSGQEAAQAQQARCPEPVHRPSPPFANGVAPPIRPVP